MADISTSTFLKAPLVKGLFSKVKGHSALARLTVAEPVPFAGTEQFIFSMDGEASIVGEGGDKPAGEASHSSVTIKPIKFIYQHRVTDEFLKVAEEKQLPYLDAFTDGFAKKIARALDIAAFHGVNPADNTDSETVGSNCFAKQVTSSVTLSEATPDDDIDAAIGLIPDVDITGIVMSPKFGALLGKMKTADSHTAMYPEFRFGGKPDHFGSLRCDVNNTLSFKDKKVNAIVGDFANMFKWGYAENIPIEIIRYGDPDGKGDLKRKNQICLRSEAYIGWGILDKTAFAMINEEGE